MKLNFEILKTTFHKPYDVSIEGNREKERIRRLALTSFSAIIQKIFSTAIPLITIRITFDYLGVEVYGLWSAVTNFFALFSFGDLGLGNGLQTKLSQASGKEDKILCVKLIASAYFMLSMVASVLLLLFLVLYPFVNWALVMNAQEAETIALAAPIVLVIVLPRIFLIPVSIITRTQYALQEGYLSNCWEILGAFISLLFVYLAASYNLGKVFLLAGTALIPFLIYMFNMICYYSIQRPNFRFSFKHVDKVQSKELLSLGILFCFLSILTTIGLSMDTFIVARTAKLSDAASYSIMYKLSIVISAALGVFAQPLWGTYGEALSRGDIVWVKNNVKRISMLMAILTFFAAICVCALIPYLLPIWMGANFEFSMPCLIWMLIMQILLAYVSPYFMVLNACGIVKSQLVLFAIYTPISFIIKYYLSLYFGIAFIPAVGVILYLLIIVIGTRHLSLRTLKQ